jgi:hypothetical protein
MLSEDKLSADDRQDDGRAGYPKTDPDAAIAFLKALQPRGPWVLSSVIPDGRMTTRAFEASDEANSAAFIRERNQAGENLYYTLNSCGRPISKPSKADMTGAIALHVDSDPNEGGTDRGGQGEDHGGL